MDQRAGGNCRHGMINLEFLILDSVGQGAADLCDWWQHTKSPDGAK